MKTVLITGAARGIGRATALKFAENGFAVAVNYSKSKAAAEAVCREITEKGGVARCFCADVSDETAVKKMEEEVKAQLGGIDVLVNNAGVALPQGLFTDFDAEQTKKLFDVNVFGMMNCCRQVVPHFVSQKSGKIINISSVWGVVGGSCEVIYSSSKAAVIGFTKALAKELALSGIYVNCVAPGLIETDMNSHLSAEDKAGFAEGIALGRCGLAQEVADVVFYLASEAASYITGQVISVDGGIV